MFGLGFSSGLPLLLSMSTLTYWLSVYGVSVKDIGLFMLAGLPYSLKFLWAPLADCYPVLKGVSFLGRRRGWLLCIQIILMGCIASLGLWNPKHDLFFVALNVLCIAFFSATQDLLIDGYRVECYEDAEQGFASSYLQMGYRLALIVAGAGVLALSDFWAWKYVFACLSLFMMVGVVCTCIAPTLKDVSLSYNSRLSFVFHIFSDLWSRPYWWLILCIIIGYKLGEAMAGSMANPLYHMLGFRGVEIAFASKIFGVIGTLFGVFVGGAMVKRYGVMPILFYSGIAQAFGNLGYVLLYFKGHSMGFLMLSVALENITSGVSSVAFVAYLSYLCRKEFGATQYALLSSLMAVGRVVFASVSGYMITAWGWAIFFVCTSLIAIPTLLLIITIYNIHEGQSVKLKRSE